MFGTRRNYHHAGAIADSNAPPALGYRGTMTENARRSPPAHGRAGVFDSVFLRLLTAFVVGFVSLTLEIAYTRVISFKLFYYYTYFVIGLALLGLGAAGAFVSLSNRLRRADTVRLVQRVAPIAALAGVLGYAIVARLAVDVDKIWVGSKAEALLQLILLFVLSASITAVFFSVGLVFASLVVNQATHMRRLYFWDLLGAAVGCLLAVPLESTIGPPAMILASLVVLALLGLAMALSERRPWKSTASAVAVVALLAVFAGQLNVRVDATKTLHDSLDVEAGDWGAVFRVDVVDAGPDVKLLHHDGLLGSAIHRYDGTPATTARFDNDIRKVAFAAVESEAPSVLIIGAAGGNEIMAALTYGAGHVDAVELNPVTADLLRYEYAEYTGHILDDPRVNYVQGDGRTFLARSDASYDLIWFVAPDSYAASNAATSGAFVLSESYLYTKEMIEESFDHLTPGGAIVAQFGDFQFDERPTRTARYLTTGRAALADRVDDYSQHVGLIVGYDDQNFLGRVSTIMLFASPPSDATVARLEVTLDGLPRSELVYSELKYLPGAARVDGLTSDLITLSDDEVAAIVDEYPFEIGAIDDNRPFFWHFTSFSTVLTNLERTYEDSEIAIGERLLVILVGVAAVVAALFLWLPFGLTRRREAGTKVAGRAQLFGYFAALGLGFMLIEISMIQRFALLLGFPTLSLSVSLFTLLIATGVGARVSSILTRWKRLGIPATAAVLIVLSIVYMAIAASVTDSALAWPQWARIAVVIALLFPIGLVLGAFLPAGIDAAVAVSGDDEAVRGRLVAWCWAVNGFFSVIGSSLTTIVSMSYGFNSALLFGLVMYVIATGLHVLWQRRQPATANS